MPECAALLEAPGREHPFPFGPLSRAASSWPDLQGIAVYGPSIQTSTTSGALLVARGDASLLYAVAGFAWVNQEASHPRPFSSDVDSRRESARLVVALHDESGLTWEQLARMLGVTRRSLHSWASGARINGVNLEALGRALTEIRAVEAGSPAERRDMLLSPGADGESLFDSLRRRASSRNIVLQPAMPLEAGTGAGL